MAMILDAFLGNFTSVLTNMAEDEVGMLLGVPGEIEKLGETVHGIQCVLSDAERKKTKGGAIERWLLQLEDVMYDADDLIDLCQIKAEERRARGARSLSSFPKFSGCGINLHCCLRNPVFAHQIGKKMKELNSRLDEISTEKSRLGLIALQGAPGPSKSNFEHEGSDIIGKTDPLIVQDDIVGDQIEEDAELLVGWLTAEDKQLGLKEHVSVVGVVGMGGIGKTTLAKKVFNDPRMKEFQLNIWACVSTDVKEVELLKCIIREAGGDCGAAEQRAELVPMLQELVRGKKFFLVLDDVWPQSQHVWADLLRTPMLAAARGSRILVTSRNATVASFMNAAKTHPVVKLSDDDAWSLLVKQVYIYICLVLAQCSFHKQIPNAYF